ncbi:MAG: hypothetical protein Q4C22_06360 [Bacillota bacterium]|nr:hypothetical protein [Bacillota bacterium]
MGTIWEMGGNVRKKKGTYNATALYQETIMKLRISNGATMRKWVRIAIFFAPAFLLTKLSVNTIMEYGWEMVLQPLSVVGLLAVYLSGFLLARGVFWGGFFGALVGVRNIALSFSNELAGLLQAGIGVVFILFYAICGLYVYADCKYGEPEEPG